MEPWRRVWREGLAGKISRAGLEALRDALIDNDDRLLQRATTRPSFLHLNQDRPVEGACGLAWCGWQGDGLRTVAEVAEFFDRVCFEADTDLGEQAACCQFLNWFDETPRDQMRDELLAEVNRTLAERRGCLEPTGTEAA